MIRGQGTVATQRLSPSFRPCARAQPRLGSITKLTRWMVRGPGKASFQIFSLSSAGSCRKRRKVVGTAGRVISEGYADISGSLDEDAEDSRYLHDVAARWGRKREPEMGVPSLQLLAVPLLLVEGQRSKLQTSRQPVDPNRHERNTVIPRQLLTHGGKE
jgi:hypothetical protein